MSFAKISEQEHTRRFSLRAAYADGAFMACLLDCIENMEFVEHFDRLYGGNLSLRGSRRTTAERHEEEMDKFVAFVHDTVYLRLPDDAIAALRARAA